MLHHTFTVRQQHLGLPMWVSYFFTSIQVTILSYLHLKSGIAGIFGTWGK